MYFSDEAKYRYSFVCKVVWSRYVSYYLIATYKQGQEEAYYSVRKYYLSIVVLSIVLGFLERN